MSRAKITMLSTLRELTVQQCFTEFIYQCKARNLSSATIRNYLQQWTYFNEWWAGTSIDNINGDTILRYVKYLQEKNVKTETINTALRILRVILNYFNQQNYIQPVKIKLLKSDIPAKDVYTDHELAVMLTQPNLRKCSFREFRTWCIINFLVGTGVRAKSLVSIKVCDLDLENNLVRVSVVKNRKTQLLPLPPSLVKVLNLYLGHRGGDPSDYLFCSEKNGKLLESTVYHDVKLYNEKRGIWNCQI